MALSWPRTPITTVGSSPRRCHIWQRFSPQKCCHHPSVASSTPRIRRFSLAHPPNSTPTAYSERTATTCRPYCPSPPASPRRTHQTQSADSLYDGREQLAGHRYLRQLEDPVLGPEGEAVMRCHLRPSHACPKSASPAAAVRMAHGTAGYSPWHLPSADVECGYLISAPLPRTAVRSVPTAWSSVSPAPCAHWSARSSSPLVLAVRPRRATATVRRCFRLGVDGRAPDDRERRRVRRLPASIPTSPASSVSP